MRFNCFEENQGSWTRDYISISSSSENGEKEGRMNGSGCQLSCVYLGN